jgi:hypothetical protein
MPACASRSGRQDSVEALFREGVARGSEGGHEDLRRPDLAAYGVHHLQCGADVVNKQRLNSVCRIVGDSRGVLRDAPPTAAAGARLIA